MLVRRAFAFIAAICAFTGARVASASPEDVFGFGPRTMSMGGTGAATARGFEAVWGNPALLSTARERELNVGFLGARFDLRAPDRIDYKPLAGSFIGAVLPVPFGGVLKDRVALGLGFFTPFDVIVRGRILYPETPQFSLADRTASVAVQVALGIDVGYGFRVGAGFAALAALTGSVLVATDASGRIGTVVEDTLVAAYGPLVGLSFERKGYRAGITYRGELAGRFNVVINVRDLGQIVVPPLNISGLAQYDPTQFAFEAARSKGPWLVAAGVTLKAWSAYPGPAEGTVRCPDIDPDTGEPATEPCGALVPARVNYSSTIVPRIGVERALDVAPTVGMTLRAGYFLEISPAPEQTKKSNLYDNTRSVFGVGYGIELKPPMPRLRFDVATQVHVLHPQTHTKNANVLPDNPGSPEVRTSGFVYAGAATVGVGF
jgi:long-subunit fatty acid transport protein